MKVGTARGRKKGSSEGEVVGCGRVGRDWGCTGEGKGYRVGPGTFGRHDDAVKAGLDGGHGRFGSC